jgi:hypothetical protein
MQPRPRAGRQAAASCWCDQRPARAPPADDDSDPGLLRQARDAGRRRRPSHRRRRLDLPSLGTTCTKYCVAFRFFLPLISAGGFGPEASAAALLLCPLPSRARPWLAATRAGDR